MPDKIGPEPNSIRRRATSGGIALAVQSISARFVLLGTQVALGWFLAPRDLAFVAMASPISTFAWVLVGFGMDEVVLQRMENIRYWERTVLTVCLIQGGVGTALLILAAPLVGAVFHSDTIRNLVLITAACMLPAALLILPTVRIQAAMDFKWIAGFNVFELVLGQFLIIVLAWRGFGAYSLTAPTLVLLLGRLYFYWRRAKVRVTGRFQPRLVGVLLRRGAMALTTRFATALVGQGDYLVLGLLAPGMVGFYFFGFRLAAMPVQTIAASLQNVLFPAFAAVAEPRRRDIALHSAELLSHLITPLCFLQILACGPGLHLIFGDKWEASIVIIQILSLGLPSEAISAIARSHLGASGAFRSALNYSMINTTLFFIFVLVGVAIDGAVGVACGVSAYYLLVQPIFCFFVLRPPNSRSTALAVYGWPFLISAISCLIAWGGLALSGAKAPLAQLAVISVTFVVVHIVLLRLVRRNAYEDLLRQIQLTLKRPSPTLAD